MMGNLKKYTIYLNSNEAETKHKSDIYHIINNKHLFCDVESLAVGLLVEPHAAERLSNDRVVRLLQPL